MRILLATSNPHKRDEILAIFEACGAAGRIDLVTLADLAHGEGIPEPVEDGETFEANAIIKACHYAEAAGMPCLADDSGLEVDHLGGAPGVRSARYSNATGDRATIDLANNRLLLEQLGDTPIARRAARFVCAMVLCVPGDDKLPEALAAWVVKQHDVNTAQTGRVLACVRGTVEGRVLTPEEAADPRQPERGRGANGFGYDPLFVVRDRGCTSAEMTPEQKNAISHRGEAARKMWKQLEAMMGR